MSFTTPILPWLKRRVPSLEWLAHYQRKHLRGDALAGVIVASTILLHLWRTSQPHMAVVGRVPNTQHFRNIRRHEVETLPHVLMLRIDESLYFANAKHIEDFVLNAAAERPQLGHLVIICNAVNFIDASALETLTDLHNRMQDAGIEMYLTEVKGPVMDRIANTEFFKQLGSERVSLTTEEVYEKLALSPAPTNDGCYTP